MLRDEVLNLPPDAPQAVRATLGLDVGAHLRITYVPGPGDVVGTYGYWREGRTDPRVPVISYSTMFYELTQALDARAQIVTTYAPPPETDPRFRFDQVARPSWTGRLRYRLRERIYAHDCLARVQAFDPHIVVITTDFPSSAWSSMSRGRRLVMSLHNTFWPMGRPPTGFKGQIRRTLLTRRARALSAAVSTSEECRRQIAQLTGGRVRGTVEHPQILAHYEILHRSAIRNLLFLGRIEPEKGVFQLLDAFLTLRPEHLGLTLTFAGSGSADDALRRRIAEAGTDTIRFLGQLGSDEVHAEISRSDLIVCPTEIGFNEGLALVGFEGAAHGVPSLLSSIVPARDLLGASCAVFEADHTGDLVRTLGGLIRDPAAYPALQAALGPVREGLYDRGRSWGTMLFYAMLGSGAPMRSGPRPI